STWADTPGAGAPGILTDPSEAYRTEVIEALKDAMLAHSSALGIEKSEWLTIAAKGNDDRPRLAPADRAPRARYQRPQRAPRIGRGSPRPTAMRGRASSA